MAIDDIDLGSNPNEGDGDNLRAGGEKINTNFAQTLLEDLYGFPSILTGAHTDLDDYDVSGFFLTPASGLTNIPDGWAQGRMVLINIAHTTYQMQILSTAVTRVNLEFRQRNTSGWEAWQTIL
jgi:hypothetical protein